MIVAQLAAVCSMTILSAWGSARQQRHRWLGEVSPSLTSPVSSRCLASCSGSISVGRSATPTVKLLINYTLFLA